MTQYYSLLTETGRQKYALAAIGGPPVILTEMAVGDGGGVAVAPDAFRTALVNEVFRNSLYRCYVPAAHPDRAVIEALVPAGQGGWVIREVGAFDADGDMIAVGNVPETAKPAPESGSEKDLYLRLIVEIADALEVVQQIDPSVVWLTLADLNAHAQRTDNPHEVTAEQVGAETPAGAQAKVNAHANLTNNPHGVTAAQLGARMWDLVASGQVTVSTGDPDLAWPTGIWLMGNNLHRHYSMSIRTVPPNVGMALSIREHCFCCQTPTTYGLWDELWVGRDATQSVTWEYEIYRRY